jgi:hypothetical protein
MAPCENLPAENTQRQLSRPKPTGVVELAEIKIYVIIICGSPCNVQSDGEVYRVKL